MLHLFTKYFQFLVICYFHGGVAEVAAEIQLVAALVTHSYPKAQQNPFSVSIGVVSFVCVCCGWWEPQHNSKINAQGKRTDVTEQKKKGEEVFFAAAATTTTNNGSERRTQNIGWRRKKRKKSDGKKTRKKVK